MAQQHLQSAILPPTTAAIQPSQFPDELLFARNRKAVAIILAIMIAIGFGLRAYDLGAESLSEDELNKLHTANEYRTNGLSGKNGEHPFLMKGLQTLSISVAESLNEFIASPKARIRVEAALRFPVALFGTFTSLLIFLLVAELFGRSIGLVSAALWAVEPMAIGFDRIAKEDSLVVFFFLLTNLFWIKSQTAAERGQENWIRYTWGAAAGFAALMASKYYPHLLAVTAGYYNVFNNLPTKRWSLGKKRWLMFVVIMGVSFLVFNPTIVLPETWREMVRFSSENRIGHDSYEYMGTLYRNQMTAWLSGVPWSFYYVFIAVKTSLPTLILFAVGLPILFKRRLGDGRFFLFFWAFMWFLPFTFLGGKFTRYFTLVEPLILIAAATGFCILVRPLTAKPARLAAAFQALLFAAVLAAPLYNSISAAPRFRLFTNVIGGGWAAAGTYFPHDEFYDTASRDILVEIAKHARPGAVVACETPGVFEYYAREMGRNDLAVVSLSDTAAVDAMQAGDFIVLVKGRRYMSNARYEEFLTRAVMPEAEIYAGSVLAARIYILDESWLAGLKNARHTTANRN